MGVGCAAGAGPVWAKGVGGGSDAGTVELMVGTGVLGAAKAADEGSGPDAGAVGVMGAVGVGGKASGGGGVGNFEGISLRIPLKAAAEAAPRPQTLTRQKVRNPIKGIR